MLTSGIFLRKTLKAARIARLIKNFPAVYSHLILGSRLHGIRLRNGIEISAGQDVDLWRLFHDIWLSEIYTRKHNPIQPGSIVFDIGASVGVFTIFAGALGGYVYSYEPSPSSFRSLLKNVQSKPGLQIRTFPFALSGRREWRVLHEFPKSTGNSFFCEQGNVIGEVRETQVECRTLADIFDDNSVRQCDFLKLNCEGAEFEILFSTPQTSFSRIKALAVECHDRLTDCTHTDLKHYLDNLGYSTSISLVRKDGTAILLARQD